MIRIITAEEAKRSGIERLFGRSARSAQVEAIAAEIVDDVRNNGDEALLKYTRQFDWPGIDCANQLRVSTEEIDEAAKRCGAEYLALLEKAAKNIRAFHERQKRGGFVMADEPGVVLGQRITPVDSAGLYVPGGTASYPSTVLMDAIPAQIAGVKRIVLVTPPDKNGRVFDGVLAAAKVAGVSEVYRVGGAQAIAALAYGTDTITPVDKIVGPGNAFVAAAKRLVFGQVGIDMIAGPSEILVVADETGSAGCIAADMLSQAEHDRMASAVLITDCKSLAREVAEAIERRMADLPRREICRAAIDDNGMIILARDMAEAAELSNMIAPEHLELFVDEPFALLPLFRHAGSIFMGKSAPEALGDYFAGPNHTLPTNGTARFSSPLGVDDFVKKSSFIYYSAQAFENVREDVAKFARSEGLEAHARSALSRCGGGR